MSFHPAVPYGADQHRSERKLPEAGPPFVFTPENRARLEKVAEKYPPERRRSVLLPALWLAQTQQGYISENVMKHVADVVGCTPAEVEEVTAFYTMYHRKPVGKYVLQVCRTLSCALAGAERVSEELLRALGIGLGETDAGGMFTIVEVECLGACDRAPVVMVNDEWHERVDPDAVGRLVEQLRANGTAALTGCHLRVEK